MFIMRIISLFFNIFSMKKLLSLLVISSLFLVACGSGVDQRPEQERYISAITEATCAAFEVGFEDEEAVEAKMVEIFSKYGFDVDDDEAMMELEEKYSGVPEVEDAVMEAFEECAPQDWLDFMEGFEDLEWDDADWDWDDDDWDWDDEDWDWDDEDWDWDDEEMDEE